METNINKIPVVRKGTLQEEGIKLLEEYKNDL